MRLGEYTIPGFDQRLSVTGRIDLKDLTGQRSSTEAAMQGVKPFVFTLKTHLHFSETEELTALMTFWRETGEDGLPVTRRLYDDTAAALGVQKARFADSVQVEPDEARRLWTVNLTFHEVRSVPERSKERQEAAAGENVSAEGELSLAEVNAVLQAIEGIAG